jgi:hypothetical protein
MNLLRQWLAQSWWRYSSDEPFGFSEIYHWFNIVEGTAWCVIAALVLRRFLKCRKSGLEVIYAAAFVTFGFSDFVEARALTTGLILAKGANLAMLLVLRRYLLRRHYPESKTY